MWIDGKGSAVLTPPECTRLLALAAKAGEVGRLGVPTEQAPVVVPVNFAIESGRILVRVGAGFVSEHAPGRLVAFESDRVDREAGTAWSVLARGFAALVESPTEAHLAAVRPLVPEPGDMILTIRPDVLTGRRFAVPPEAMSSSGR